MKNYAIIKRIMDISLSIVALILLFPIFSIISITIRLTMGSPILFCQTRIGFRGKPFTILKFRSMNVSIDEKRRLLDDSERLTKFGKFLRKTSLDELPELINVLRGEMSLVGPRPLLIEYLNHYKPEQAHRHDVKPGITGWAQVNGRQAVLFSKRLELDVWYVDHCSLFLDLKILLMTIPKTLFSKGVIIEQDIAEVDDLGLSKDLDYISKCKKENK